MTLVLGATAVLVYLATTANLYHQVRGGSALEKPQAWLLGLIGLALLLHLASVHPIVFSPLGYDFSFFPVASLIFLIISFVGWLTLLGRQPVHSLLIVLFPLTAIAITCSLLFQSNYTPRTELSGGVAAHVLLSIVSVGLLTVAAIQALMLLVQMQALKQRQTHGMIDALPPLLTMESLLFRLLWAGFICLSAGLLMGGIYVEDLFAQHLLHKTVFSMCAWCVFAGLLWGRHQMGWSGRKAVNWTLAGLVLLAVGFFGSKLVLELILQKPA